MLFENWTQHSFRLSSHLLLSCHLAQSTQRQAGHDHPIVTHGALRGTSTVKIMSILFKDPWSNTWSLHFTFTTKCHTIFNTKFSVLTSVETTLGHLHQCGICHACLSLKQSWHQEGRARSSCPHCPEPPYRPGCMGRTMHKDLQAKHTLLNSFHTVG